MMPTQSNTDAPVNLSLDIPVPKDFRPAPKDFSDTPNHVYRRPGAYKITGDET